MKPTAGRYSIGVNATNYAGYMGNDARGRVFASGTVISGELELLKIEQDGQELDTHTHLRVQDGHTNLLQQLRELQEMEK